MMLMSLLVIWNGLVLQDTKCFTNSQAKVRHSEKLLFHSVCLRHVLSFAYFSYEFITVSKLIQTLLHLIREFAEEEN